MKLTISCDDDLMKRIDDYAQRNYMSRSGLIALAATQYLNSQEMVTAITDMSISMRKIADEGKIAADTEQKLEDFERVCKVLTGKQ